MPKSLIITRILFSLAFIACIIAAGCGYPKHIDPPIRTEPLPNMTFLAASVQASSVKGQAYYVLNTHSMEPFLHGGDYVVIAPQSSRPYSSLKAGEVIAYHADWYKETPVTHRLVQLDKDGWILSGDHNPRSEANWRVTEKNFIGVVDSVYRTQP